MKKFYTLTKPEKLYEDWPGKYSAFSWLEYVLTIPNPMFLVTTLKENDKTNACLHSWGLLVGGSEDLCSVLYVHKHMHTYENVLRTGEWVLNYPSVDQWQEAFQTITVNEIENDEITAAGFTLQPSERLKTPGIKECCISVECKLDWHHSLCGNHPGEIFVGKVQGAHVELDAMSIEPEERMKQLGLMYNIHGTVHPETLKMYGPNTIGLLNKVKRITPDKYFDSSGERL